MTTIRTFVFSVLAFIALFQATASSFGQSSGNPGNSPTPVERPPLTAEDEARIKQQNEEAAAAVTGVCAVCGGGVATLIGALVVTLALNIALLVWVARDAKSRGMDSSVLWMFLVMFTSLIGLVIYIFARPQGTLAQCPHCKGKRLQASATCPHCRNP